MKHELSETLILMLNVTLQTVTAVCQTPKRSADTKRPRDPPWRLEGASVQDVCVCRTRGIKVKVS